MSTPTVKGASLSLDSIAEVKQEKILHESMDIESFSFSDDETNQSETNKIGTKCGTIYISDASEYTLVCLLCRGKYETMSAFAEHIKKAHTAKLSNEIITTETVDIKSENTVEEGANKVDVELGTVSVKDGSTSNLLNHLISKHSDVAIEEPRDKRSMVWKFYEERRNSRAKCVLCSRILSFKGGSINNLVRHLTSKHSDVTIVEPRPKRSIVWKFYEERRNSKAKCVLCSSILSFKGGSLNNLVRHLTTKHPGVADHIPRVKRSNAWKFFEEKRNSKMKCVLCSRKLSCKGGSTHCLVRHLTRLHPGVYEPVQKTVSSESQIHPLEEDSETESSSDESSASKSSAYVVAEPSSKQNVTQQPVSQYCSKPLSFTMSKLIDRQLVKMIVKEYQPIRIVEDSEFKKLLQMLNPEYSLPCRKTISDSLLLLYNETKEKVSNSLTSAESVTITTDGWTSLSNQSYIAIAVHFIDDDCSLVSHLLDCFELPECHTSENLAYEMKWVVSEWDLQNKISAVVSDNASNISSAIRSFCHWPHITCFAHSINLIVQAGLKEIKETQVKVKSIVEFFKRSSRATSKLLTTEKQMGYDEKKLKQEVPTRWHSTYYMFSRILEVKDPVLSTLSSMNSALTLSQKDWQIIEKSCKILQIFEEVTIVLSSGKTVSISMVIVLGNAINSALEKFTEQLDTEDPEELTKMLETLLEELSERFSGNETNVELAEAVLLDPRFKRHGFSQEYAFKQAYNGISHQSSCMNISSKTGHLYKTESDKTSEEPSSALAIWNDFDDRMSKMIADPMAAGIAELDKYLQEPYAKRGSDPLLWWKERKMLYPRLYKIMKKRLCVMATSVPCDRVFSKSGELISERRRIITSNNVREIMFLNYNL